MKERYIVIIKWNSCVTSEVLFDDYCKAVNYYKDFKNVGDAVYLTKIMKVDDNR